MVTADELEVLARRTVATMRRLSPPQSDPELAASLATVLAAYRTAKRIRRLGPLIRDGVM